MSNTPNLASLRQLLAEEPDWLLWNRLVEHLDQWPEDDPEWQMAWEYTEAHLDASWTKGWRQGNHQWAEDSVGWKLVKRHLHQPSSLPDATEVWCPPAEYMMGDNSSAVKARVERGFWALTTSVTQQQWISLLGDNPSYHTGDERRPVEMTSWYDACAFCNALSRAEGLEEVYKITNEKSSPGRGEGRVGSYRADIAWISPEANGYRLPTEVEWEWAARAGSTEDRYGNVVEVAWHASNEGDHTKPVGTKPANAFGLHDMLGNVYDWSWESISVQIPPGQEALVSPYSKEAGGYVYRGGNFSSVPDYCRANYRSTASAHDHYTGVGFRVFRNG